MYRTNMSFVACTVVACLFHCKMKERHRWLLERWWKGKLQIKLQARKTEGIVKIINDSCRVVLVVWMDFTQGIQVLKSVIELFGLSRDWVRN